MGYFLTRTKQEPKKFYSNYLTLPLNCSMPFSVEDIHGSIKEQDLQDVKPPAQLLDNPIFQFLQE